MPNSAWTAATTYAVGDVIVDPNGNVQQCTAAGTSGEFEPQFAAEFDEVTPDGDELEWTCRAVLQSRDAYAAPQDMIAAFPNRDLVQLTNEDPTATTIDTARLQTALEHASNIIDSYIEARYELPFNTPPGPPKILRTWAIDIAMYRLQVLRPLHDMEEARARYDDANKKLTLVNQGKLTLGLTSEDTTVPVSEPRVLTLPNGAADALARTEAAAHLGMAAVFGRRALLGY